MPGVPAAPGWLELDGLGAVYRLRYRTLGRKLADDDLTPELERLAVRIVEDAFQNLPGGAKRSHRAFTSRLAGLDVELSGGAARGALNWTLAAVRACRGRPHRWATGTCLVCDGDIQVPRGASART